MIEFFYFIFVLMILFYFRTRIKKLEAEIKTIRSHLKLDKTELNALAHETEETKEDDHPETSLAPNLPTIKTQPIRPFPLSVWLEWLKDNWTIAAGATLLAFGLMTTAVYLAFYVSPSIRVGSLALLGAICVWGGYRLRSSAVWSQLCIWLVALGGSLWIGTALGATYLESMQLVHQPAMQICVLISVMMLNMLLPRFIGLNNLSAYFSFINLAVLGYLIHSHAIDASHQNQVFVIAAVISVMASLNPSVTTPLLSLIWLTGFNYEWLHVFGKPSWPMMQVASILIVSLVCLGRYYWAIYRHPSILPVKKENLALHVLSWITLGINLYPYHMGLVCTPYIIGCVSLLVAGLSYWARHRQSTELFYCDWVVSQALLAIAIFSWGHQYPLHVWWPLLVAQGMIAIFVLRLLNERSWLFDGACLVTILLSAFYAIQITGSATPHLRVTELGLLALLGWVSQALTIRNQPPYGRSEKIGHVLFWAPLVLAHYCMIPLSPMAHHIGLIALAFSYIYTTQKWTHSHTVSLVACGAMVGAWAFRIAQNDPNFTFILNNLALIVTPMIALTALAFDYDRLAYPKIWGTLYVAHISLSLFALCHPYSDVLPSLIMIGVSYFLCETYNKTPATKRTLAHQIGLLTFVAFLCLHAYVDTQTRSTLGHTVSYSFLIAGFGLYVGYMWLKISHASPNKIGGGILEGLLGLALLTIFIEAPLPWQPLCYATLGVVMLQINHMLPARSSLYRLLLLIGGCLHVGGINRFYQSPLDAWYAQTEIPSIICLLGLLLFGVLNTFSTTPARFQRFQKEWNILPAYGVALLFLSDRFDHALLSLSWVVCASMLIGIAFYVKSKNALQVAYATILVCLVRIAIFDLSQEALHKRAIILIASGLLLISIHVVYKRFASRLETEPKISS